jgi:hypothetical protein
LFSTGAGGYLFREDELATVRIPSMLFMGEREEDQRRGSETMLEPSAKIFRNVWSPKYFLEIKGATHFSFNNRFADNRRTSLLSGTEEQFEVIRRYSIAFLEKHVAGRQDTGYVLEGRDPLLTRYVTEPMVNRSKQDSEAPEERLRLAEPSSGRGHAPPLSFTMARTRSAPRWWAGTGDDVTSLHFPEFISARLRRG